MNERIKQLAEQAEKYADANFKGEVFWSEAYESKFAELIVEECATVVERNLFQGIGWNTSRAVRRHFGIGEEE